jgi:hypothetical protein
MKKTLSRYMKFIPLIFTGIILLNATACKKDNADDPNLLQGTQGDIAGHYEFVMQDESMGASDKFYRMTFLQSGGSVTGDISVHDSAVHLTGTIAGTLSGGILNLEADLGNSNYSFRFNSNVGSARKPSMIAGTVTIPVMKNSAGSASVKVNLFSTIDWHCHPDTTVNAYVFKKVWSATNPVGQIPVILVHGMTGEMANWDSVRMNLSDAFKAKHDVWRNTASRHPSGQPAFARLQC